MFSLYREGLNETTERGLGLEGAWAAERRVREKGGGVDEGRVRFGKTLGERKPQNVRGEPEIFGKRRAGGKGGSSYEKFEAGPKWGGRADRKKATLAGGGAPQSMGGAVEEGGLSWTIVEPRGVGDPGSLMF